METGIGLQINCPQYCYEIGDPDLGNIEGNNFIILKELNTSCFIY
jgi:hypothetical protein